MILFSIQWVILVAALILQKVQWKSSITVLLFHTCGYVVSKEQSEIQFFKPVSKV